MKAKFFIAFVVGTIILVGGLGIYMNRNSFGPSKFDGFAQALKNNGAEFYGAFWCPHCQEQKDEFGSSKKYLPYIECSNVDNSQKQICIDNQIEGYPAWKFRDGVILNSEKEPLICEIQTGSLKEPDLCVNRSSKYARTWLFPDFNFSIKSPTDPIKEGNVWKFPKEAQISGKLPFQFLAEQINFTLPQ